MNSEGGLPLAKIISYMWKSASHQISLLATNNGKCYKENTTRLSSLVPRLPHCPQTVTVPSVDCHRLIPRLPPSHFQTTTISFPDYHRLIPRLPPSHSQTTTVSSPDYHRLIPRLPPSHPQTTTVSFPDCHRLIPKRYTHSFLARKTLQRAATRRPSWLPLHSHPH